MEQIYTIPVNEAFEASAENKACGCAFCALYEKLEENELDLILGASMMEPDVRIKTNKQGFCRGHYEKMFVLKNRLGMALTMESHIAELRKEIKDAPLSPPASRAKKRIAELEGTCYVCSRIAFHFEHMFETAALLYDKDEAFRHKLLAQPYFCLPHYRRFLAIAEKRLGKKLYVIFAKDCASVVEPYFEQLQEDVSWFCKKFDYRYDEEPWYNSKDAVERAIKFLRGRFDE